MSIFIRKFSGGYIRFILKSIIIKRLIEFVNKDVDLLYFLGKKFDNTY